MKYKKNYFGFVYLWFDTKHNKFIIGSHHGSTEDGYTTSTGGVHVKRIFNKRPETMKRKILQYNILDDKSLTKTIEQKFLDMRTDIGSNPRYCNMNNTACGGIGGWDHINNDPTRINPMSTEAGRLHHKQRMQECVVKNKHHFGTHCIDNNPMKNPEVVANHPCIFTSNNNPMKNPVIAEKVKQTLIKTLGRIVVVKGVEYPSLGEASRCLGQSKQMLRHRMRSETFPDHYFKEEL